jgi:hypothetical protein
MENSLRSLIGKQYMSGKFASENSEFVAKCFREFAKVNAELFKLIPFRVEFTETDSYQSAKEMRERVIKEKVIYIFTGYSGHPFLSHDENNISRAVHDVWAHLVCGCPFSFKGEFNAYLTQRKHYPSWTWNVLFTEIPAQTAAFYHCGDFPDIPQRAFISPVQWVEMCEMELSHDYTANAIMSEQGQLLAI